MKSDDRQELHGKGKMNLVIMFAIRKTKGSIEYMK